MGIVQLRNMRVRDLIKQKREIYAQVAMVTAADVVDRLWLEANHVANKGFERIKALELLGRALGMFKDQPAGVNPAAAPVTIYIPDNGRPVSPLAILPAVDEDVG